MSDIQYSTSGLKMEKPCIEPIKVILYKDIYNPEESISGRFRVLFIESGTGTCNIYGKLYPWIGPCLLCLNEKNTYYFMSAGITGPVWVLYFHPGAVNSRLTMENIYDMTDSTIPEVIENQLLLTAFTDPDPAVFFNHINPEAAVRVRSLFESIRNELDGQATSWWPCLFRSYLAELLFFIGQKQHTCITKKNTNSGSLEAVNVSSDFAPVLDFVIRYYNTKISLECLARKFGTNRTSLNKRFKTETGMTAIAWLIDLRLRIASSMLINTYLPVSEIAERVGIGDISYFERIFRQKYRQSPKSYRLRANGSKN